MGTLCGHSSVPFPSTYSLVQAGCVGVLVFLDNGDNQGDELGPEIQVFDAGALLLGGHIAFLSLEGWGHSGDFSHPSARFNSVSGLTRGQEGQEAPCNPLLS